MVRVIMPFMFAGKIWMPNEILDIPESECEFLGSVLEKIQTPSIPETKTNPPNKPPRKPPRKPPVKEIT